MAKTAISKYLGLQVRLGAGAKERVSDRRLRFHARLLTYLFPESFSHSAPLERIGDEFTLPFDHFSIFHHAADLKTRVVEAVTTMPSRPDVVLIDFLGSRPELLREQISLYLSEGIDEVASQGKCDRFVVVLPYGLPVSDQPQPGAGVVSLDRLSKANMKARDYAVYVVGVDGTRLNFASDDVPHEYADKGIADIIRESREDPLERLERKVIRRMGHFASGVRPGESAQCRLSSFFVYRGDRELRELIDREVGHVGVEPVAVFFDCRVNAWMSDAIRAFAERRRIPAIDVAGFLVEHSVPSTVPAAYRQGDAILIVDVVDTGTTVHRHLEQLAQLEIRCAKTVVAAIARDELRITLGSEEFVVRPFVKRAQVSVRQEHCVQCEVQTAFIKDDEDHCLELRAFDIVYMADTVGWGPEPVEETPGGEDRRYPLIPKFTAIINDFGPWLGYKMARRLAVMEPPVQLVILCPEEGSGLAVAEALQAQLGSETPIVKIPRPVIDRAQLVADDWKQVLPSEQGSSWLTELKSAGHTQVVIVDVFNASGSTFRSLRALLGHLQISVFCFFPLVDFDPDGTSRMAGSVKFATLFNWWNPRRARAKASANV